MTLKQQSCRWRVIRAKRCVNNTRGCRDHDTVGHNRCWRRTKKCRKTLMRLSEWDDDDRVFIKSVYSCIILKWLHATALLLLPSIVGASVSKKTESFPHSAQQKPTTLIIHLVHNGDVKADYTVPGWVDRQSALFLSREVSCLVADRITEKWRL